MPIQVRYAPWLGVSLAVGAILMVIGGFVGDRPALLGLGVLNFLAGLGYATRPMFVVHPTRVEVKNILGMTLKTVHAPLAELDVRGSAIFRDAKRVAGGMFTRRPDMERVATAVREARETTGAGDSARGAGQKRAGGKKARTGKGRSASRR